MPYRVSGESNINEIIPNPKLIWTNIFKYDKIYTCPACNAGNKYYGKNDKGFVETTDYFKGCLGVQKFLSSKYICPNIPHLHVNCWCCELNFLMWSE